MNDRYWSDEPKEVRGLEDIINTDPSEWGIVPGTPWWKSYEESAEPLTVERLQAAFRVIEDRACQPDTVYFINPSYLFFTEPTMSKFQAFIARAKVVFNAAPTYLVAASAIAIIVSDEVSTVLPAGAATVVAAVTLKVVAVLGAAVSIIRRVKPVLPSERGIL